MNPPLVDNPQFLLSRYHPAGTISHLAPQQAKRRGRRRKGKGGDCNGGSVVKKKRKLSDEQASMLEQSFTMKHGLETGRKDRLAGELGLEPGQVAVWFQNRRARWRCKKMEEDYAKLRSDHEAIVLENCFLETQITKLMEQLEEAKNEIQRLSEHQFGLTTNSPNSSSLSTDTNVVNPSFWDEFAAIGFENWFYLPWTSNYDDWEGVNLYSM